MLSSFVFNFGLRLYPWGSDAKAKSRAILLHLPKAVFELNTTGGGAGGVGDGDGGDGAAPVLPTIRDVVKELAYVVASTRSSAHLSLVWPFCGVDEVGRCSLTLPNPR